MHRRHHTANRALVALSGVLLTTAACAPTTRPDPPALLGALTDRPPPAVAVTSNGPYANPLADPVRPIITAQIAAEMIAPPLLPSLSAESRLSLADASWRAVSASTGTTVQWQSADASGAVVPARDPYRSHRGQICRDLQQRAQTTAAAAPAIDQITLCHDDLGDGRVLWLPGPPD